MRVFDRFLILLSASVTIWSMYNANFGKKNIEGFDSTETVFLDQNAKSTITLRTQEKLSLQNNIDSTEKSGSIRRIGGSGTAFKVGDDLWITARHVVRDCKSIYVRGSFGEPKYNKLIEKVLIHPVSDLAMFRFASNARHFYVPSMSTKERKNSLYGTTAFGAGYPAGMPGQIYVKYLGDSILNNRNHGTYEPIFNWVVSLKTPESLKRLSGMSGGPLFNSESKVIGVTITERPRRGIVTTSDPDSINWFLGVFKSEGHSKREISELISVDNFNDISNKYRHQSSIMKVICKA